jgi:adenine phosphoribosyltransferase
VTDSDVVADSSRTAGASDAHAADILRQAAGLIRDLPDFPQPGVLFKDITPLLADARLFAAVIDAIVTEFSGPAGERQFDLVVGVEARGFILAAAVAYASGVGFVPVRKAGKLPAATVRASYDLEYGSATIEMHADAVQRGQRVLVVDDVLATGGTLAATLSLLESVGASITGVAALLEIDGLAGRSRLGDSRVHIVLPG